MKICTYVMTTDCGLAPNPFWDSCTLAVCTPNHMGARLNNGDWIAGFLSRQRGGGLVYAMKVDEILHFDEYYRKSKYKQKKPTKGGRWPKPVGDNMYFLEGGTRWKQHPTDYHVDSVEKDTSHPFVFTSKDFFYFGKNRPIGKLPSPANKIEEYWLNRSRAQGLKYFRESENPKVCKSFVSWLRNKGGDFICDEPIDREPKASTGCDRPQRKR